MSAPNPHLHVVINPAAGSDEPVLSMLNDICRAHEVTWDISVTDAGGDAERQAREALERGVDLVAGYGGDGTQHARGIPRRAAQASRTAREIATASNVMEAGDS